MNVYLEKRDVYEYPPPDDYYSPHVFYPEYPFPIRPADRKPAIQSQTTASYPEAEIDSSTTRRLIFYAEFKAAQAAVRDEYPAPYYRTAFVMMDQGKRIGRISLGVTENTECTLILLKTP